MRYLKRSIALGANAIKLMSLGPLLVTMVGCSTLTQPLPNWPNNLNVISLSDGGVCLDAQSAKRLAELRAELEQL